MDRRGELSVSHAKVVLLTNFIAPYRVPMLEAVAHRVGDLRVWVSTAMEANRQWHPEWGTLNVEVQRSVAFQHRSRHPHGYSERQIVHVPYDTLFRLRRERPDVVLSAEFGARTVQAALYCAVSSTPLVMWATLSESSEKGRGPARRLLRRALLPRADAVLVNGRSGARYVRELGARADRVITVPYTSTLRDVATAEAPARWEACRLLYVGQLIERKGIVPFVAAVGRWGRRHPGEQVMVQLVGDGPEAARLARVPLPENVTVRTSDSLPYQQIAKAYQQASLFVLPTLADEWGLVVNEAMAAGLPVLGSVYSQAVEELVQDGVNGWVFRPDDPEAIDAVLERALLVGAPELARMGAAARDAVRFLTPELAADRLVEGLRVAAGR
jgi:glycosyltransferase involved in cell wall biosynthesis